MCQKPSSPSFLERHYPQVKFAPLTAVRLAGFIPVILVLCIIALAYITAVPATLYPLRHHYPTLVYPLLFLFHFIYINVVVNYLLLVFVDPGSPPSTWNSPPPSRGSSSAPRLPSRVALEDASDEVNERLLHDDKPFRYSGWMRERAYDGGLRYCGVCQAYKPDRSHHCSVCRRCILRMDHHCVFVNNCVSFINHKFFVNFVLYAFLGCTFVAVASFPTFAHVVVLSPGGEKKRAWGGLQNFTAVQDLSSTIKTMAMIGYIMTTAFAFALAIFVALHFYLVAKGRTTIELYELTDPARSAAVAEYDLGMAKNFRAVLGNVPLCWFLPTRAYIDGDGLRWQRRILRQDSNV